MDVVVARVSEHDAAAVTVVVASAGYPATSRSGDRIDGIDAAEQLPGVQVQHAFTARADSAGDGGLHTAGGRVLVVTATADDLVAARDTAYAAVDRIRFDGAQFRTDIAQRAVEGAIVVPEPAGVS